jgi:membrane protease subunit HflC
MADAEATKIYNEAYGADPEFYAFYRTLESYSKALGRGTTMMLGGDSEYFKYFQSSGSAGLPAAAPEASGATNAGQNTVGESPGESQPE